MAPMGLQDRGVMVDTKVPETSSATRYPPHRHLDRLWQQKAGRLPLDNLDVVRWIAWLRQAEVAMDQHEAEEAIHLGAVMVQEEVTAGQGVLLRRVALGEVDTLVTDVEGTVLAVEVVSEWPAYQLQEQREWQSAQR